jgi:hypothetical protein
LNAYILLRSSRSIVVVRAEPEDRVTPLNVVQDERENQDKRGRKENHGKEVPPQAVDILVYDCHESDST